MSLILGHGLMTFSIFDSSGNLVDAYADRVAALERLTAIVIAEPHAADDVFLLTQDDAGRIVGETIYGSSVSVPA